MISQSTPIKKEQYTGPDGARQTIGLVLSSVPGYSETFFRSKIRGLQESGHRVILFAASGKSDIDCEVVAPPQLSGSPIARAAASLQALATLMRRAPGRARRFLELERRAGASWSTALRRLVINSHILPYELDWLHFGFATMSLDRELVGKAIGAKVATSFRGYDVCIYPLKHPGCYRRLWQHLDKVHTISDDLLEAAYALGLSTTTPVCKIPPAIVVEAFAAAGATRTFDSEKLRLLAVGRLHWKKGLEYALQALAIVQAAGVDFRFTIAGEGEQEERLLFAAHQFGIADKVDFLGKVPHEAVARLMADNDYFLQYSLQEGFCNAVLEAQAAGMLCLVSDAEGLPENVVDGETGVVVPKMAPDRLAAAILRLHRMPETDKRRISAAARARVQTHFRIENQHRAFHRFYSEPLP